MRIVLLGAPGSGKVVDAIAVKLLAKQKVFDSEVKSALRQFQQESGE